MGTHLTVLSKSYPMNTNMTYFIGFKSLHSCALDESSLSTGRVNTYARERGTPVLKALHAGIVWIRRYPERG